MLPDGRIPVEVVESCFDYADLINDRYVGRECDIGRVSYYVESINEVTAGIMFFCPGCMHICSCNFTVIDGNPVWSWNGSREAPTIRPSIVHDPAKGGCGWHGYLTDGFFKAC